MNSILKLLCITLLIAPSLIHVATAPDIIDKNLPAPKIAQSDDQKTSIKPTLELWDDALVFLQLLKQRGYEKSITELGLKCRDENYQLSFDANELFYSFELVDDAGAIVPKLRALLRVCFEYSGNTAKLKDYLINPDDSVLPNPRLRRKSSSDLINGFNPCSKS